jgi:predicted metal-dependent phosphoesterase TrpH
MGIFMNRVESGPRWLKAEMHAHCSLDPVDYKLCSHSAEELISTAAALGYDILAITCHNLDIWSRELEEFAESQGITLIPGMEVNVEGRYHTLLYNFRTGSENLNTFEKIRSRSREDTLVLAPHPYFPASSCLRNQLEKNIDIFDAIEVSGFYLSNLDFNEQARSVARKHHKTMIGNGDVHLLWQLGKTFTWIYAEPTVGEILTAVKRGAVRIESKSLALSQTLAWWATAAWRTAFPAHPAPSRKLGAPVPDSL